MCYVNKDSPTKKKRTDVYADSGTSLQRKATSSTNVVTPKETSSTTSCSKSAGRNKITNGYKVCSTGEILSDNNQGDKFVACNSCDRNVMYCQVLSSQVKSCLVMSCRVTSRHVTSRLVKSHHAMIGACHVPPVWYSGQEREETQDKTTRERDKRTEDTGKRTEDGSQRTTVKLTPFWVISQQNEATQRARKALKPGPPIAISTPPPASHHSLFHLPLFICVTSCP